MKLINYWKSIWWRRWSTWLAAVNGLCVTYIFSQPILVIGLLGFAPGTWLVPLAVFFGFLAFGLPVLVSMLKQPALAAKIEEKKNAEPIGEPSPAEPC
jgi:hypothetical protein